MIKQIVVTIKKEKNIIRFIFFLFLIGLILGTLFTNYINNKDKVLLINQIGEYFTNIKSLSKEVYGSKLCIDSIHSNILLATIIYALGISIVGLLVVIIIIFFKGFISGITLSSIILKYKYKKISYMIIYTIFSVLPSLIVYTFISFFSVYVSIKVLKALIKKDNLNFKTFLGKYVISYIASIIMMIILSIIESYLTPAILKLFT